MPIPMTLKERLAAAWRAFQQNTKADPLALSRYMEQRARKRRAMPLTEQSKAYMEAPTVEGLEAYIADVLTLSDPRDQLEMLAAVVEKKESLVCEKPLKEVALRLYPHCAAWLERQAAERAQYE